uniref:ADP-ribosylation factor-like 10 n=1 Tax=Sparus aurata TaxID=8175 RepID=A0A671UTU7_SPAAU
MFFLPLARLEPKTSGELSSHVERAAAPPERTELSVSLTVCLTRSSDPPPPPPSPPPPPPPPPSPPPPSSLSARVAPPYGSPPAHLHRPDRRRGCSGLRALHRPQLLLQEANMVSTGGVLHHQRVGGGEDLRRYWSDYLRRTHVLVYVVDSSDRSRLPLAKAELHRLLRVEPGLPVVVLGNKQDKPNAVSVSELHEALSLGTVTEDRKLFLLAAQLGSDGALRNSRRGLDTFQDLLLQLV